MSLATRSEAPLSPMLIFSSSRSGSIGTETPNQSVGAAQVRFHGVLAPNSRYRDRVTPGKVKKPIADAEADGLEEPDLRVGKRKGLCWAKRLKRVFTIDVSICRACGGTMKIIASIEDPFLIGKILSHLKALCVLQGPENRRPGARAPPPDVC